MNCESGNDSSIFVSEIIRIFISEVTSDAVSNLFLIKLIFISAIVGFWGIFQVQCFQTMNYIIAVVILLFLRNQLHYFSFGFEFQSEVKSISPNIRQKIFSEKGKTYQI